MGRGILLGKTDRRKVLLGGSMVWLCQYWIKNRLKALKFVCHSFPYAAIHEENIHVKALYTFVDPDPSPGPKRFGVYLAYREGTPSFYSMSSHGVKHLYTFHTTFNKPMNPMFHLTRPHVMDEVSSIIIVTQSPDSIQHTEAQLFQQLELERYDNELSLYSTVWDDSSWLPSMP